MQLPWTSRPPPAITLGQRPGEADPPPASACVISSLSSRWRQHRPSIAAPPPCKYTGGCRLPHLVCFNGVLAMHPTATAAPGVRREFRAIATVFSNAAVGNGKDSPGIAFRTLVRDRRKLPQRAWWAVSLACEDKKTSRCALHRQVPTLASACCKLMM